MRDTKCCWNQLMTRNFPSVRLNRNKWECRKSCCTFWILKVGEPPLFLAWCYLTNPSNFGTHAQCSLHKIPNRWSEVRLEAGKAVFQKIFEFTQVEWNQLFTKIDYSSQGPTHRVTPIYASVTITDSIWIDWVLEILIKTKARSTSRNDTNYTCIETNPLNTIRNFF